ncbi:MAG: protein translocase subunit SecD, partial [Melioribacteraceae bacterium]|nr:protein translocase subunit SecD [Melioribacteraceae bacterium]
MKEFRFRIIMIVAFFGLSLYLLYPTFQDYQNSEKINAAIENMRDSIKTANPNMSSDKLKNILNYKEDSLMVSDPSIKDAREKRIKLGLDLQGGMYLVMEVNTAKLLERLVKDPDQVFFETLNEAA